MSTATAPRRMTLESVRRGLPDAPDRILMVGTEGIGKSTFGASAPSPIFIAAEDGIRELRVAAFPEPLAYTDVTDALDVLVPAGHVYQTVVIDTLDWLEPLLWKDLCARNQWKDIESPGYGKGYVAALDDWRALLAKLDRLRARGMTVILLAHAQIKLFNNPAGPDFSRYELALHRGAAALCKQWADVVLFAAYEEFTQQRTPKDKAKAVATGARIMHTERTAAWDAKNRFGLPPTLPLDWAAYVEARKAGRTPDLAALVAAYGELMTALDLPADKRAGIEAFVGDMKDPRVMARIVNRLQTLRAEKE